MVEARHTPHSATPDVEGQKESSVARASRWPFARPLALLVLILGALAITFSMPLHFSLMSSGGGQFKPMDIQLQHSYMNDTDYEATAVGTSIHSTIEHVLLGAPTSACWRNAEQLNKAFQDSNSSEQHRQRWAQYSTLDLCSLPDTQKPGGDNATDPGHLLSYARTILQCDASTQSGCSAAHLHVFRQVMHVAAHGTARYYMGPSNGPQPQPGNYTVKNVILCSSKPDAADNTTGLHNVSPFLRAACEQLPNMLRLMGSIAARGEAVDVRWDPTLPDVPGRLNHPLLSTHPRQVSHAKSSHAHPIDRASVASVAVATQMAAKPSPNYMVAFALHNNERVMPHFLIHILALVTYLPPGHVLVSCYESGSTDGTAKWLKLLQGLLDLLHVPNFIQIQGNVTRTQIPQRIAHLAAVRNQVLLPLQDPAAYAAALARVHHPLGAIAQQHGLVYPAHKLIFLNDAFFSWQDVIRMTNHDADMVCGLDFDFDEKLAQAQRRRSILDAPYKSFDGSELLTEQQTDSRIQKGRLKRELAAQTHRLQQGAAGQQAGSVETRHAGMHIHSSTGIVQQEDVGFWPHANSAQRALLWGEQGWFRDIWVARDISGRRFESLAPVIVEANTQELANQGLPFPVQCCWNAGVVVNATVHLLPSGLEGQQAAIDSLPDGGQEWLHILDTSAPLPAGKPAGLKFRPPRPGQCLASECTTFCNDLWGLNYSRILVDPYIRMAYAPYGHHFLHEAMLRQLPMLSWKQMQRGLMARYPDIWQLATRPEAVMCCPENGQGAVMNWMTCYMDYEWFADSLPQR